MVDSALVGYPPANDRDLAIIKGILSELPPALAGTWSPEKGTPPSPNWPPLDERNSDSKAGEIIASSVVAMFVLILITGTRLGARWTGKYNRMGWDDYFIIMAAVELLLPLVQLCVIANEAVLVGVPRCMGMCVLLLSALVILTRSLYRYPLILLKSTKVHWGIGITTLPTRTRNDTIT